jgi:hypothetical protein
VGRRVKKHSGNDRGIGVVHSSDCKPGRCIHSIMLSILGWVLVQWKEGFPRMYKWGASGSYELDLIDEH